MANILKKVTVGNPLYNLGMLEEAEVYHHLTTDEELARFYHHLLHIADAKEKAGESHELLRAFTYSMIAFSTGWNFNERMLID